AWLAYVWMWGLLDLTVLPESALGKRLAWSAHAIVWAQLGVVAVWAIFGHLRWTIRWPVAAALLVAGGALIADDGIVASFVAAHVAALLVAGILLAWFRFRLAITAPSVVDAPCAGSAPTSLSLSHSVHHGWQF